MHSTTFLHEIRHAEIDRIVTYLGPGRRILELGGGTGYQAQLLVERGFDVASIDVADSNYAKDRVFDVLDYDGVNIPFESSSFDVVFSSNVLEHVRELGALQAEIKRVLRPGGHCVHVMPTAVWRFWSNATHLVHHLEQLTAAEKTPFARAKHLVRAFLPARHGETGNAVTELYTFSRAYWLKRFEQDGFIVESCDPLGLFYTGYKAFGPRWDLPSRARWARRLGSAGCLYRVRPRTSSRANSATNREL